jgi:hypothetical protein
MDDIELLSSYETVELPERAKVFERMRHATQLRDLHNMDAKLTQTLY